MPTDDLMGRSLNAGPGSKRTSPAREAEAGGVTTRNPQVAFVVASV